MTSLVWVGLFAALGAWGLTHVVRAGAQQWRGPRRGEGRAADAGHTPRLGGVAVAISWFATVIGVVVLGPPSLRAALGDLSIVPILAAAGVVFGVGLIDDVCPLSPGVKVAGEALASAVVIGAGIVMTHVTVADQVYVLGPLAVVATLTWLLVVTNAFNLIDGLDGLATGLAIIAGATCAAIVWIRADVATAVLLVALVGSLVGFLPHNLNPASIYLGDGGSLFIGFVLAVTALTGFQKGATTLAAGVPLLIFALPLLDTAVAVVRRLRGHGAARTTLRAAVWRLLQPDDKHIHHRLVASGLSHRAAVAVLYAVAVGLSVLALVTVQR